MDKVTAVHRHLNREQWKTLITECRTSGMSVTKWCKVNGIYEQTYYKKGVRDDFLDWRVCGQHLIVVCVWREDGNRFF